MGTRWVTALAVAPVKGLGLDHPESVELTAEGVPGDRRFFLVDATGRLVTAREHGALLQVRPSCDAGGERLALRFPDGGVAEGPVERGEPVTTQVWGRLVEGRLAVGPWSERLTAYAGRPIRLVRAEHAAAFDDTPATLLSDASVERLAAEVGEDEVDGRRFRMLLRVGGCQPHEEDGWIGRTVSVGGAVLRVVDPVGRCAVTTLDPDSGRRDLDTLRAIAAYRGVRDGREIDFGVHATVERPGRVAVGDVVDPG